MSIELDRATSSSIDVVVGVDRRSLTSIDQRGRGVPCACLAQWTMLLLYLGAVLLPSPPVDVVAAMVRLMYRLLATRPAPTHVMVKLDRRSLTSIEQCGHASSDGHRAGLRLLHLVLCNRGPTGHVGWHVPPDSAPGDRPYVCCVQATSRAAPCR